MSSSTHNRPVITLQPSTYEDVKAYMAAIRLASSVRNSMDAKKARVDVDKAAINADSYGRHHPNFPPPPSANMEPVPILNQTSSAKFASNTTKPGFVHLRDRYPSPSQSVSTGTRSLLDEHASAAAANLSTLDKTPAGATPEPQKPHHGHFPPTDPPMSTFTGPFKDTAAATPAGVKREALEQHHGYFPPPEPPIGSSQGGGRIHHRPFPPPGKPMSTDTGPLAIEANHGNMLVPNSTTNVNPPIGSTPSPPGKPISRRTGPIPIGLNHGPSGIPHECQLFVTNTDVNNVTFAVCPVTKLATNPTHNLTSRQLRFMDVPNSHVLTIRNTAMCEAPTGFNQRIACEQFDGWFALAFFILFSMIGLAWMKSRRYRTRQLDEEDGNATWPHLSNVSTDGSEAKPKPQASKVSTNTSEAKMREKLRKAHVEDQRLDEGFSVKQYEPVAWRSASHRAARANVEGSVKHDAGPVGILPTLPAGLLSAPHYGGF